MACTKLTITCSSDMHSVGPQSWCTTIPECSCVVHRWAASHIRDPGSSQPQQRPLSVANAQHHGSAEHMEAIHGSMDGLCSTVHQHHRQGHAVETQGTLKIHCSIANSSSCNVRWASTMPNGWPSWCTATLSCSFVHSDLLYHPPPPFFCDEMYRRQFRVCLALVTFCTIPCPCAMTTNGPVKAKQPLISGFHPLMPKDRQQKALPLVCTNSICHGPDVVVQRGNTPEERRLNGRF